MAAPAHTPSDSGDQLVADVLAAHTAGLALEPYLAARSHGATHDQVLNAADRRIDLVDYARALAAGATEREIQTAASWTSTRTISGYARARAAGATHDQTHQAATRGHGLADYARLREAGVSHDETLDQAVIYRPLPYRRARRAGATHAEVAEVWSSKSEVWATRGVFSRYITAREGGQDHHTALAHATSQDRTMGVVTGNPAPLHVDIETPFEQNWLPEGYGPLTLENDKLPTGPANPRA